LITFASDFLIYYFALSTMMGFDIGLMKLLTSWIGFCYDFSFSLLFLEDNRVFWDWHYFNYFISAREALGLILAVIWEYLEVWVPLLKPELVALVRLTELKPFIEIHLLFLGTNSYFLVVSFLISTFLVWVCKGVLLRGNFYFLFLSVILIWRKYNAQ
jgi:hypothetical protein